MDEKTATPPVPIIIASAETIPPSIAPPEYRPHLNHDLVYDDELEELVSIAAWRPYFAGGSNRLHFVIASPEGKYRIVEQISFSRYSNGYNEFENAYDAFWECEVSLRLFTDPKYQQTSSSE